jgi:hypothetical protein
MQEEKVIEGVKTSSKARRILGKARGSNKCDGQ